MLEKSFSRWAPTVYDGRNHVDSAVHGVGSWYTLYTTLQVSNVNSNANLTAPDTLANIASGYLSQGMMPFFVVNHAYQYIRSDAISLGLFTTSIDSTTLYDNPGRAISPYYSSRLFAGSAYRTEDYSSTGEVLFVFPSLLFKTDTLADPIQVDFGDGAGYRDVNLDVPISINYLSSGLKHIKIVQGPLESISDFSFTKIDRYYEFTPGVNGGDNSSNFQTNSIGAPPTDIDWQIVYGCGNILDKPVLIVEGLAVEKESTFQAIFNVVNGGSHGYLDPLIQNGYDIVLVKFKNNSGSIFDNATALEHLINYINSIKIGNQPLNIIGYSMGGVVTKYCLKSMESRSVTHNVANYISFDAPHQGAYIPYGLQTLFDAANSSGKKTSENPDFKFVYNVLNSTAAKQLLQIHYHDFTGIRQTFASAYAAQGYPTQCNNYAITDGSINATSQGMSNGAKMLDVYGYIQSLFLNHQEIWSFNTSNANLMYFEQRGALTVWPISLFSGVKREVSCASGYSSIQFENSPGSNDNAHVLYGQQTYAALSSKVAPFGQYASYNDYGNSKYAFVPTVSALDLNNQNIGVSNNYISNNPFYNISTSGTAGITPFSDYISTGTNEAHLFMTQAIADFMITKIYGSLPSLSCQVPVCTTVPVFTPNAEFCQYQDQLVTISNFPNGNAISWSVPFGVTLVSGQNTSQIHIISNVSGNITLGATITYPGCSSTSYPVTLQVTPNEKPSITFTLTGTDCTAATVTANAPGATSFDWTTTGGVTINGGGTSLMGTSSSTVTINGYNSGTILVRAYYNNACGPSPYAEHCFEPCNGSTGSMSVSNGAPYRSEPLEAYAGSVDGATSYLWYSDNTLIETTFDPSLYTHNWQCDEHTLYCVAVTPCGLSYAAEGSYDGICDGFFRYMAYPNPTSDYLNISPTKGTSTTNDKDNNIIAENFSYTLYDTTGSVIRFGQSNKYEAKIDVRNLKRGLYIIHIKFGGKTEQKQIIIK